VAAPALYPFANSRPAGDECAAATTDEELVERCRAGSEAAFAAIVARYELALTRHCARIVGRGVAEDAVQEAFVAAWVALRAGVEVRGLRPWLFTIARRTALRLRARSRYTSELTDAIPGARSCAQDAEQAARAREALAALATLPTAQRDALVGSALHGRSGTQLARELGVTEATVRQLVFRARERLRIAAAACVAPPLALLRLIRRFAATAVKTGTAQSSLAAGTILKAGVVLVFAAGAVGVGETLHASRPAVHAPIAAPTGATGTRDRHAARSQPRQASVGSVTSSARVTHARAVARDHARSLSASLRALRHGADAASAATLSLLAMPWTSSVGVARAGAQPRLVGGLAGTATATAGSLEPTVAAHIRALPPVLAQTVGPPVHPLAPTSTAVTNVVSSVGTAGDTSAASVDQTLGETAQTVNSAGQGVTGGAPAVVQSPSQTTQGAAPAVPVGATTAAPSGVVQSSGATAASGPSGVPGV
jgi:RNA polymerase sigma-70 factor (ECF subfamily)